MTAPAAPKTASDEEPHFDAASSVYGAAKSAWSWSRGLPVAGSVLGMYESAGSAVLTRAMSKDLASIDKDLDKHVGALDKNVLDPAIARIFDLLWPAIEGFEDVLKTYGPKIPFLAVVFPMIKNAPEEEHPESETPVSAVVDMN